MALDDVHIWLGRFDSSDRWGAYLDEHYYEDDRGDRPLSQFAADQGEVWYDHDWIEGRFFDGPQPGSRSERAKAMLSVLSYSPSYIDASVADAVREPLDGANACLSINSEEISRPRSATGDGYELHFVGTYQQMPPPPQYDPEATDLNLNRQRLTEVPPEVFELTGLVELSLGHNELTSIPDEIEQLHNLVQLNIYKNQLTEFPDVLFRLPKLQQIMAQDNPLRTLPTTIGEAPSLRSITVSGNSITHLPDQLGDASELEFLNFSRNQLTELPASIGRLSKLTSMEISANDILRLPEEITALTFSKRLNLPRSFDNEAQSPAVQAWLAQQRLW